MPTLPNFNNLILANLLSSSKLGWKSPSLPAARFARPAGPKITLRFPHLYVRPHLSRAQ